MVAVITGRVPGYTQNLHRARTARAPWQERPQRGEKRLNWSNFLPTPPEEYHHALQLT